MLTVSLHGIRIQAPIGLYDQEHILNNEFEVDVDISLSVSPDDEWPVKDYTQLNAIVRKCFEAEEHFLEQLVRHIHQAITREVTGLTKARVAVRKLNPPMPGSIRYAQVCYEG